MRYKYIAEIKHTPKYKNGAFRKKYVECEATDVRGVMLKVIDYCEALNLSLAKCDVVKANPTALNSQFQYFQQQEDRVI